MKFMVGLSFFLCAIAYVVATSCNVAYTSTPDELKWVSMESTCYEPLIKQIHKEIGASYSYLKMGAHFSKDTVNRPGFAEFFFKAAKEEREHGIKLIDYLSMRGYLDDANIKKLTLDSSPVKEIAAAATWKSGAEALQDALKLETTVTESILSLIRACDNDVKAKNDYHFVDYLTGVYLEEQYRGQRELAGKIATLNKMQKDVGIHLAEFLFDKEI